MVLAVGCESPDRSGGAGAPDSDWPPRLEAEAAPFEEAEGGGLLVRSADGSRSLIVYHGEVLLDRGEGERVSLIGLAELARGEGEAIELAPPDAPSFAGLRASFERGAGVIEWYEPRPSGLEQGWTIAEPPREGAGPLRFSLALGPNVSAVQRSPGVISLRANQDAIDYTSLVARDAEGAELPSSMTLLEGLIVLEVDDTDATYPLEIDPLVVMSSFFLDPWDGVRATRYGVGTASFGNLVAVGDPERSGNKEFMQGAVHIFRRTKEAEWVFDMTIRVGKHDEDPAELGASVDLWGNVLVVGAPGEGGPKRSVAHM